MKFKYNGEIIENEDRLKEIVCAEVDEWYIRDFLDDTYEEFSTNLDDFSPSEIIDKMCGGFDGYRKDEDLFEYLCDNISSSDYRGFYAEDYFDVGLTEVMTIADIEFEIIFDEEEIKAYEGEEEEDE